MRERLFTFFSDCWKQAGGVQAKIPTYFSFEEKKYELMDLVTEETLTQEEIAARLES